MVAFLKNSGDIILDAVLTDEGRRRLSLGNGKFNITHFALGDDEINYELYDVSHPQGTAYADLNILKTPILEAVTDNASGLKHRLMTLPNANILYLPLFKLNKKGKTAGSENVGFPMASGINSEMYVILCTENAINMYEDVTFPEGFIKGKTNSLAGEYPIVIDQGINSGKAWNGAIDPSLEESRFIINIDDRFGKIVVPGGNSLVPVSFVDDDQIATYFITYTGAKTAHFTGVPNNAKDDSDIDGPRGQRFKLCLRASDEMIDSSTLFTDYGYTISDFFSSTSANSAKYSDDGPAKVIDALVKIAGDETGSTMDIPIRFVREA